MYVPWETHMAPFKHFLCILEYISPLSRSLQLSALHLKHIQNKISLRVDARMFLFFPFSYTYDLRSLNPRIPNLNKNQD